MNQYQWFNEHRHAAFIFVLVFILTVSVSDAVTRFSPVTNEKKTAAVFSFDSIWFYNEGVKVIPEISLHWLTVVYDPRYSSSDNEFETTYDSFIREKSKTLLDANNRLVEFFCDRNLAENACFFRMRTGLNLQDVRELIAQINQDEAVQYVHPALVIDNKTFAFFNVFQIEWKTSTDKAQRESLLNDVHAVFNEKENYFAVDVTAIPFFRALNLLAEDIRVLRATPYLVEIKPSIRAQLSLYMSGGTIGDRIPFTFTISFSDRVTIDPSSIALINLRPSNLQKELFECTFDPYDYSKAVTKSPIVISGNLKFFAPGEFTLPPIVINYTCPGCSGKTVRSFETNPVVFKVASIRPSKSETGLIVPSDPIAPIYNVAELHGRTIRYLWISLISCAGFILCAILFFYLLYNARRERSRLNVRKKEDLLAEQLRRALQTTASQPHWSYLAGVGSLLREFLIARYGIDLKYSGGSSAQFVTTIKSSLPPECVDSLHIILAAIDNCVSLESETYPDIEQLQREVLKFIDLTSTQFAALG